MTQTNDGAGNERSLESMVDEVDDRLFELLEEPDVTDTVISRHFELAPESWVELRSFSLDPPNPRRSDYSAFYLNGTTSPSKNNEGLTAIFGDSCPHGPVFSFIAVQDGRYHGRSVIDPSLLQVYPNLDVPELKDLVGALITLAATIAPEDIDDESTFRLPTDSDEAALLHTAVTKLLAEGTIHTRRTTRLELKLGRIMSLESNELSDRNLPPSIAKVFFTHHKPLSARLYDGDTSLLYAHTKDGDPETIIEPSGLFERYQQFATNIMRTDEGEVVAWSTNVGELLAYQATERALGMYQPSTDSLDLILSGLKSYMK
jgi:hypothetical protein